jgi:hypothetical protein
MVFSGLGSCRERSAVRQLLPGALALHRVVCVDGRAAGAQRRSSLLHAFHHDPRKILEGNWYSCRESDGSTASASTTTSSTAAASSKCTSARAASSRSSRACRTRTAITNRPTTLQAVPRRDGHGRAKQRWEIPSLNLAFTVTLAGGSRTDCESWFIVLEPIEKTSH